MSETATANGRLLLFVHGRDFKPERAQHLALCVEALRAGIGRDCADRLPDFDAVPKASAWFGDLTAALLAKQGRHYDEALDIVDRHHALEALKALNKAKKFSLPRYDRLPGKTAFKEFLADVGIPLARPLGLSAAIIRHVAPELGAYWNRKNSYGDGVRARILEPLRAALQRGDDVAVISHGIGTVATFDALWELSHGDDAPGAGKVSLWITLGSPLGDPTVKARLRGARRRGAGRYPSNVLVWHNVSAEDDYACYDKTIRDDYSSMLTMKLISRIEDSHIYNLAVRYGRSNPHSSVGYLIHPRVVALVAGWLASSPVGYLADDAAHKDAS